MQAGEYLFRGAADHHREALGKVMPRRRHRPPRHRARGAHPRGDRRPAWRGAARRRDVFLDLMRSPQPIADLDPRRRRTSRATSSPTPTASPPAPRAGDRRDAWSQTFRQRLRADVRPRLATGRPARSIRAGGHPRQHRRERGQGRPTSGRSSPPSTATASTAASAWPRTPPSSTPSSASAAGTATSAATTCGIDSPYNTYRYAGLPPGPICSPGARQPRRRRRPRRRPLPLLRQPQRRHPRLRRNARRAQPQRRHLAAPLLARPPGRRAATASPAALGHRLP